MASPAVPLTARVRRDGHASARLCPQLADGRHTTVHVAAYVAERTDVRVAVLAGGAQLAHWCARRGIGDAVVGGFFVRDAGLPLGEVRTSGVLRDSVAFDRRWAPRRACVHVDGRRVTLAPRYRLPEQPRGDLLQAGPLLVDGGTPLVDPAADPEGFSAGSDQFDSDITSGRYPRAALGVGDGLVWAVTCDGRSKQDAGMTLAELADFMARVGAESAINLDGGGSASLVCGGVLVNNPRNPDGSDVVGGRSVHTAITFTARG